LAEKFKGWDASACVFSSTATGFFKRATYTSASAAERLAMLQTPDKMLEYARGQPVRVALDQFLRTHSVEISTEPAACSQPNLGQEAKSLAEPVAPEKLYFRWSLSAGADDSRRTSSLHSGAIPPQIAQDIRLPAFLTKNAHIRLVDVVVRLGSGGYCYPAHQDWSSNFLLQIFGKKRVRLHRPDTALAEVANLDTRGDEIAAAPAPASDPVSKCRLTALASDPVNKDRFDRGGSSLGMTKKKTKGTKAEIQ